MGSLLVFFFPNGIFQKCLEGKAADLGEGGAIERHWFLGWTVLFIFSERRVETLNRNVVGSGSQFLIWLGSEWNKRMGDLIIG